MFLTPEETEKHFRAIIERNTLSFELLSYYRKNDDWIEFAKANPDLIVQAGFYPDLYKIPLGKLFEKNPIFEKDFQNYKL